MTILPVMADRADSKEQIGDAPGLEEALEELVRTLARDAAERDHAAFRNQDCSKGRRRNGMKPGHKDSK